MQAYWYRLVWISPHCLGDTRSGCDHALRFYRDILGMEIIFTAPAGDLHGRHCAFHPGGDLDRLGLHFFEYPQAPLFSPEGRPLVSAVFDSGATFLFHISLALPDEASGLALQERLTRHNVVMSPIMDQGDLWNLAFFDNNGLVLEAAWPKQITG